MALFRITVTRRKNTAGMLIEPGMSVQIASFVNGSVVKPSCIPLSSCT